MNDRIIEAVALTGFDPDGDPALRIEASGRMWLVFNVMPPSWLADEDGNAADDLGPCERFGALLERATGVPVLWDDREVVCIEAPRADPPTRIQAFLSRFRTEHDSTG